MAIAYPRTFTSRLTEHRLPDSISVLAEMDLSMRLMLQTLSCVVLSMLNPTWCLQAAIGDVLQGIFGLRISDLFLRCLSYGTLESEIGQTPLVVVRREGAQMRRSRASGLQGIFRVQPRRTLVDIG